MDSQQETESCKRMPEGMINYVSEGRLSLPACIRDVYQLILSAREGYRLPEDSNELDLPKRVEVLEKHLIRIALGRFPSSLSLAAKHLNITRQGLYKKMNRYGIVKP